MSDTSPAVLLVADISGYTRFMRLHALSERHARLIVIRLLEALVRSARPPLQVAELEGDAVFFFALADQGHLDQTATRVKGQIPRLFQAFRSQREALRRVPACVCDACSTVGDLRLKQVVHTGQVAVERVSGFEKLFGLDVIVVHRMLKNSVEASEYVMMTDGAHQALGGFYELEPERHVEALEGVGDVPMTVFKGPGFDELLEAMPAEEDRPSATRILWWKLAIHARTVVDVLRPGRRVSGKASA